MNLGLLQKTIRESAAITCFVALGLFAVQIIFGRILPSFFGDVSNNLLSLPLIRRIISAVVGVDPSAELGLATMAAMVWSHPVVLTLVWTLAIWAGTRVPAAEVDRGTIDVLLSLPVSRSQVLATEAVVALLAGLMLVLLAFAGNTIGGWPLETHVVGTPGSRLWVTANLWAVFFAAFGASCLASSLSDRRGRAVGVVVAVVLASFVLSFVAAFSEPFRRLSFLSVLNYYRPVYTLQGQSVPVSDILVLFGIGSVCWVCALRVFLRRDIRTV